MYLKANKLKLRFDYNGKITVEDLFDLKLYQLNEIAKKLRRELKNQEEEDFLSETTEADAVTKLKFDIVIDILNRKKEEAKIERDAAALKIEEQKLLALIAEKEDDATRSLSLDELKQKLASLRESK